MLFKIKYVWGFIQLSNYLGKVISKFLTGGAGVVEVACKKKCHVTCDGIRLVVKNANVWLIDCQFFFLGKYNMRNEHNHVI